MNDSASPSGATAGADTAARRLAGALSPVAIDRLLADAEDAGVGIDGPAVGQQPGEHGTVKFSLPPRSCSPASTTVTAPGVVPGQG